MLCEHGNMAPCVECDIEPLKAENETLLERLENYEALKRMHRLDNYPNELSAKAWLLRKKAEAVEALAKRFQDAADKADRADEDESDTALTLIIAKSVALKEAYQLRQQADEIEQAGGER